MSQATLTLNSGPGKANTATVISNLTSISFNLAEAVLFIGTSDFPSPRSFELSGSNTITLTAVAGNYTLTIT